MLTAGLYLDSLSYRPRRYISGSAAAGEGCVERLCWRMCSPSTPGDRAADVASSPKMRRSPPNTFTFTIYVLLQVYPRPVGHAPTALPGPLFAPAVIPHDGCRPLSCPSRPTHSPPKRQNHRMDNQSRCIPPPIHRLSFRRVAVVQACFHWASGFLRAGLVVEQL